MAKPKILLAVRQHTAARFIVADYAAAFAAAGYPTLFADLTAAATAGDAAAVARQLDAVRAFGPDVAVGYGFELFAPLPGAADLFTTLALPAVNLVCDFHDWDIAALRRHPQFAAMTGPDCLYLCWDTVACERMRADGFPRAEYFPLAVNPDVFRQLAPPGRTRPVPVSFIGIASPERIAALEPLAPLGLRVHGPGSRRWEQSAALRPAYRGGENDRAKLNRIYNDAYLSVNITQTHGRDSLNLRVFESLAAGTLLVTESMPALARHFRVGEELVAYGPGELERTVRHWLDRPDEGAQLAARGRAAVLAGHTYAHRVAAIADLLPTFILQRAAWRRALDAGARGDAAGAIDLLLALLRTEPPFAWTEHLLAQLATQARALDPAAADTFTARLRALNPASFFLKKY